MADREARRGANRIRGPQSALTDFLAANNISAAQIRDDYQRRREQAEAAQPGASGSGVAPDADDDNGDEEEQAAREAEIAKSKKRKRAVQDEAISKIKKNKAKNKTTKKEKKAKGKEKGKGKKPKGDDDEDGSDVSDSDASAEFGGYKKSVKLPGQLANCEICDKRFTVTPYSKNGPEGGLCCTPCSKELTKEAEKAKKEQKKRGPPKGKKRRQIESNRLDGKVSLGAKSLQQLCLEVAPKYAEDMEDLGDLPQRQMDRLSEIFSKKRVMKSGTLPLFLQSDTDQVTIRDCAYLEHEDYVRMIATCYQLRKIALGNACQFKSPTLAYLTEKSSNIRWLHLYASNLIDNDSWDKFFEERGQGLECLQLSDLDTFFENEQLEKVAEKCPKITRLKLKRLRRITPDCLETISTMENLEHLSLQFSTGVATPNELLKPLIEFRGANLRTLSLEGFMDADDDILATIADTCNHLNKLRINANDTMTDAAWGSLFENWSNPPLRFIDVSKTRDVDNSNPDGPEDEPIGIGQMGFESMMQHSGSKLEYLHIASCRHIPYETLTSVFDGEKQYPELLEVDMSFVTNVDTLVLAGLFKSAPKLRKVVAFGCFAIEDVVVPQGVVVIGVPRAQDQIEQFGVVGMDVDGALGGMLTNGNGNMDLD